MQVLNYNYAKISFQYMAEINNIRIQKGILARQVVKRKSTG
ncbi:hypothetical protein OKW21_005846 [Catalinimonas alkaloidigena]|nr:hypothetical protein [Catalinimonas alkaloidigena]